MKKYVYMALRLLAIVFKLAAFGKNAEITKVIPPGETICLTGRIYEKEEKSDYQILYLKNISITYQEKSITQSRMIIYDRYLNKGLALGNTVFVKGNIQFFETERNPGNFDQKFYYQKQNIHASLWANEITVVDARVFLLRERLDKQKNIWKDRMLNAAGEKYGGILCAMLLADKEHMDPEVKELYQESGIAHILAISGLHLSIIGHGFYQLVRRSSG